MNRIDLYESKHQESYALSLHHHENYQLLYVIEGEGSILIDGIRHDLMHNNAAIIVPYSEHAVSSDSHLTLLVLAFGEQSVHGQILSEWKSRYYLNSQLLRLNSLNGNELRLLLRKLLFRQRQKDELSNWAMQIHLHEILLLLARAKPASQITDANNLRAERTRCYIDQHYYEPITSKDLAAKMNMSIRHTNNIFKEQYHMTPMQYLTEVRISTAKKLLTETDKDIVTICFEIGYESLPTFYRAFKNVVKMSPNKFRQQQNEASMLR
ncbi:AraC family transcriptional regulator [Paenibacillus tarimensis]